MILKVYFLDDEKAICENFVDFFSSKDVEVTAFTEAEVAIQVSKENPPDIIFTHIFSNFSRFGFGFDQNRLQICAEKVFDGFFGRLFDCEFVHQSSKHLHANFALFSKNLLAYANRHKYGVSSRATPSRNRVGMPRLSTSAKVTCRARFRLPSIQRYSSAASSQS